MPEALPLEKIFANMVTGNGLIELAATLVAIGVALIGGRIARSVLGKLDLEGTPPWSRHIVSASVALAPFVLVIGLVALALLAVRLAGFPDILLLLVLRLVIALAAVRLFVYGVQMLLGRESWVSRWENTVTGVIWLGLVFETLGWFVLLEQTLDVIDLIPGKGVFSLWALLKSIVVVSGFLVATTVAASAIERRVMAIESIAPSTRIGIAKTTFFLLISVGILLGINATGVDLTALTVLTGAIVFGLGFGIRDITSNFVSGFVLLMDKSIKPGDVISFTQHTGTTSENFGWVQELRGRYVVVRDRDGVESLVPNQNLITNSVINWSYSDQRVRLRLPVMISYDDDPEVALELLIRATSDHPRILRDPGPVSRLMSFENYGMKLEARFWIRDPMNGVNNVRSDVNRRIYQLFRENKIKIPVAQQEVRVLDVPPLTRE